MVSPSSLVDQFYSHRCFVFFSFQNVYSKILISGERYRYTAAELQFGVSLIAVLCQLPLLLLNVNIVTSIRSTSVSLFLLYFFNALSYHVQWLSAYAVMSYISPITHR